MKHFSQLSLDAAQLRRELLEYDLLLRQHESLDERKELLPFFQKREQLAASLGFLVHPNIFTPSLLAFEYDIFGDFRADLVVGDPDTHAYCFIEFENAKQGSILKKSAGRFQPDWSSRFLHGFSQVSDWFRTLENQTRTETFEHRFGAPSIDYMGILVIGRDSYLDAEGRRRLTWWQDRTLVNSRKVYCFTFDQLLFALQKSLGGMMG
ncbi:MAG: Shedu anti-phage system protein SduA domain-containing protein [Bacteroidota bacterium]